MSSLVSIYSMKKECSDLRPGQNPFILLLNLGPIKYKYKYLYWIVLIAILIKLSEVQYPDTILYLKYILKKWKIRVFGH